MFLHLSVSHSVNGGLSASVHAGIHPPRQTPPQADTPHGQTHPWADTPQADTPGRHPPPSACWDTHPHAKCMIG